MGFDAPLARFPLLLSRQLAAWFRREGAPRGDCAAVGVSVSGQVDASRERVLDCAELALHDYPLAREWARHFPSPVHVYNGLQAEALCHLTNPVRPGGESFVYVRLQGLPVAGGHRVSGTESAIVLRGSLYTGARGQAGRLLGKLNHDPQVVLSEADLARLADAGAGGSAGLDELARELGQLILGMMGWLDVDRVILGGALIPRNEYFMSTLNARVRDGWPGMPPGPEPRVQSTRLDSPAAAHSAGLLACEWAPAGGPRAAPHTTRA